MAGAFQVRGEETERSDYERSVDEDLAYAGGINLEMKHVVDVSARARSVGRVIDLDLDDGDVVEYRDANGWVDFTTVRSARARSTARGGETLDLVDLLVADATARGGRDLSDLKAYSVEIPGRVKEQLDILERLAEEAIGLAAIPAARFAARKVVEWVERTVPDAEIGDEHDGKAKTHGLYRIDERLRLSASGRLGPTAQIAADGTSLVMIHGTFSSTEAAFSALRTTDEWARTVDRYDGRVYSLEHKTLSVNPIQNAIDLATHLPDGATLDMVSHSRGGLVGDYLSLAAAGLLKPDLYTRPNEEIAEEERELLQTLVDLVADRDIRVNGFVRAAAPARGTILASPRLDTYVKFLLNVVPKAAGPLGWIVTVLKSLVLAFLDQRADPRVIPGVEAMMPDSPFVRLLNASGPVPDHLGVIAGDVDRSRWFKWFLEKGADLFYGQEHDYVVDTLSMYQGAGRDGAAVSLHAGPNVNHFTYFSEADSRRRMEDWLAHDHADSLLPGGFAPLDRDAPELVKATRRRDADELPLVIVVPDVMGTALLDAHGGVVWPSARRIAVEGVASFGLSADLLPGDLLSHTYGPLLERLGRDFDVEPFGYDWRRSLRDAAGMLAARLSEAGDRPVSVVAHGAGGLLVKEALGREGTPVPRRVLLLGTPTLGTLHSVRLAAGQGALVDKLRLLDPARSRREIGRAFRNYLSLLEIMPAEGIHRDPVTWQQAGIQWAGAEEPTVGALAGGEWPGTRPVAVAGTDRWTPVDMEISGSGIVFRGRLDGDGVVDVGSATAGSSVAYHLPASHGELPSHPDALAAYVDILRDGRTHRLSTQPSTTAGDAVVLADERDRHLYPTSADIEGAALGMGRPVVVEKPDTIEVDVAHGDLRFAAYPVVVGHYAGSTLEGAEKALDRALRGRLTHRDVLGVYPGAAETADVMRGGPRGRPPGAVIVGLGELGTVTGHRVTAGVTEGAVRLAMVELEARQVDPEDVGDDLVLGISSVLMGTSGPSNLSIEDSVESVIAAVAAANRLLADQDLGRRVRFGHVQFVEKYEDVAIEAMHAIHRMVARSPEATLSGDRIAPARYLGTIEGGRSGQPPPDYDKGEWRPIMVESVPWCDDDPCRDYKRELADAGLEVAPRHDGGTPGRREDLAFTSIGMAARAEQTVHARQRDLLEHIVDDVIAKTDVGGQLNNTLYELLLPNYLKGSATDADNLLLVLDSEATRYPWEMLASRLPNGELEPLSIRSGMIRRLLTPATGERRRAGGHKALVVGDPPTERYPALDGAVQEAIAVADLLSSRGYTVTDLIRGRKDFNHLDVLNALFSDDYRIVHVAAHGIYSTDPEQSGVVIGDDMVLSALTVRQMRTIPPLVFLNCCHLGQIDRAVPYRDLAASISEQLVNDGVRAVVAAGWAVDDVAARIFATSFYEHLLAGRPFGDSVREARRRTRNEREQVNTWGAYQCYGDPGFKLTTREAPGGEGEALVSPTELERLLDWFAEDAADQPERTRDVVGRIDEALSGIPGDWRTGSVLFAAGTAYSECGEFRAAIDCFVEALAHYDARAPIKLIEQLANLEGRVAEQLAREEGRKRPGKEVQRLIDSADNRLRRLDELAGVPTGERLRLTAAHHRRRAYIYRGFAARLRNSLEAARDAYEAARRREPLSPDHTINRGVFEVLLAWSRGTALDPDVRRELTGLIGPALEEAERRLRTRPEFWNRVAVPDGEILQGLLSGDLADREESIARAYVASFEERSTNRQRASIISHVRLLADLARSMGHDEEADVFDRILGRLESV